MREPPEAVMKRLEQAVLRNRRIMVSDNTYSEMPPRRHWPESLAAQYLAVYPSRCHTIMLWDRDTIDATTDILVALRLADTVIAAGIVIATNKIREFNRMQDLDAEELG